MDKLKVCNDRLSVNDKKSEIISALYSSSDCKLDFTKTFNVNEGITGAVTSFLAILDLAKENFCDITHNKGGNSLYITIK